MRPGSDVAAGLRPRGRSGGLKPAGYEYLRSPWAITPAMAFAWHIALAACPVCFKFEETATVSGIRAAVVVLVAVSTVVLGACGTFAVRFAKRESALSADRPETR